MDGASTSTATLCQLNIASHNKIGDALGSWRPSPPRPRAPAHLDPYSLLFSPPESWNCQVDRPRPTVHRGRSPVRTC